jgi:imidazole glycerol-phosphate synthase subunit HisH
MKTVIIKYNAGNIRSVLFALERIGMEALVTDEPDQILSADKIIFPGVGEASSAMRYLRDRKLDLLISNLKQPVLGVCLGMQLLCTHSEENDTECLGIFSESIRKFTPNITEPLKVPQMGWNNIYDLKSELFTGVPENSFCYFVHGYYAGLGETTIAKTDYVQPYSSALHKNNFYGVQFHPEKSAGVGERILKNFIQL